MRITFELTPVELESAAKDGTLSAFLSHAVTLEKAGRQVAAGNDEAVKGFVPQTDFTATAAPGPGIQMPGSNLPPVQTAPAAFNPTISAPAAEPAAFNPTVAAPAAAPAAFDPMAFAPVTPAAPAATNAPATVTQTAPPVTPGAPQATIDEVRAKIAPLIKAGKVAEMQALFAEFGAQKLTDVNPAHYAALIARAATI